MIYTKCAASILNARDLDKQPIQNFADQIILINVYVYIWVDDVLRTVTTILVFSNFEYHIQLTGFGCICLLHMFTKLIFQHVDFNKDFLFNCSSLTRMGSTM